MKFIQHTKLVTALSIGAAGMAMAVPQELVDGLGDESYQLREKAEIGLAKWAKKEGKKGLDILSDLKKRTQSPEVKSRLDNVISGVVIFKAIPNTRGYMGIVLLPKLGAVGISRVVPNSPAAKAGLQANDNILWLDGIDLSKRNKGVMDAIDFVQMYVKSKKAGEKLTLKIERNGEELTKILKLADYDKEMMPQNNFNNFNNGGIQILPMQGAGGRGMKLQMIPVPGNKNLNLQQFKLNGKGGLQFKLEFKNGNLKQLPDNAEIPPEIKDMLKQHKDRHQKKLDQLEKELNLKKKEVPKK